jgi:hypothetical protein
MKRIPRVKRNIAMTDSTALGMGFDSPSLLKLWKTTK